MRISSSVGHSATESSRRASTPSAPSAASKKRRQGRRLSQEIEGSDWDIDQRASNWPISDAGALMQFVTSVLEFVLGDVITVSI